MNSMVVVVFTATARNGGTALQVRTTVPKRDIEFVPGLADFYRDMVVSMMTDQVQAGMPIELTVTEEAVQLGDEEEESE